MVRCEDYLLNVGKRIVIGHSETKMWLFFLSLC